MPRTLELALLFSGLCWVGAASLLADQAAAGLTVRFHVVRASPLLAALFFLFLLLCGFAALNWIGRREAGVREANALPARSTALVEWGTGAAIGWGALLTVLLLPMLFGAFKVQFWWGASAWVASLLSLLTALVGTLAIEVAFRGYVLSRAIAALGRSGGALLMALIYSLVATSRPNATGVSVVVAFVAGLLLSLAYLRTHALWMGWGMHFAWVTATAVLFGLPVSGIAFNGVVDTESFGHAWLSGGAYGPEGAVTTAVVLLLVIPVLYRATRDFAWNYTHPVIVAAGYPMDVPPPAAHTAMEGAAPPPPLVQILSSTPGGAVHVSAPPSPIPPSSGSLPLGSRLPVSPDNVDAVEGFRPDS